MSLPLLSSDQAAHTFKQYLRCAWQSPARKISRETVAYCVAYFKAKEGESDRIAANEAGDRPRQRDYESAALPLSYLGFALILLVYLVFVAAWSSTPLFGEMITHRGEYMMQKSAATQASVLFVLALVIAGVLEAVARICNLLNSPVNAIFLAAGAISAAIIWGRRT